MSKRNRIKNQEVRKAAAAGPVLSSYDPVIIEIPAIEITEEEVLGQMRETAERFPEYVAVDDRAVRPGDSLLVTMETVSNGLPIENLTYENHRVDLSDASMPEGLREHLLTMAAGETRTCVYEAPGPQIEKTIDPEMVTVRSTITLHEIQEPVTPEITDEWVSTYIPGADTVEEFHSRVRRQMESKAASFSEEMKYSRCAAVLASRLEGPISDELFEKGVNGSRAEFEEMLKRTGVSKEQYLFRQGMTEEDLAVQLMAKGRQMIAEGMALEAMADYLHLKVEDEDINAVFGTMAPQQAEHMRKAYERAGKTEELQRMAYCGKALEYVVAHAEVIQKKMPANLNPFEDGSGN